MTEYTIREYFAVDGAPFTKKDAAIIGPQLYELSRQGGVTARDVLDAARSEQSPLHPYFEWEDAVAADLFRLEQGRKMLRSIKVRYTDQATNETHETRAFQIVRSNAAYEPEARTYHTFQVLHGDSAFAVQMLGSAFDDLKAWKTKYEPYTLIWKNFGDVFQQVLNQIDEWADEYRANSPATETDEALLRLLTWREECSGVLSTWTNCRESIGYVMDAIKEAEAVFELVNETKTRECMKCGREFVSLHSGHRLCGTCLNSKTVNKLAPDAAMSWDT